MGIGGGEVAGEAAVEAQRHAAGGVVGG